MTDTVFYASSADILEQCNSNRENLDALLDPENGFAPKVSRMCKQKMNQIINSGMEFSHQDEIMLLRQESNTWDLLQALMSFRKTAAPLPPTAHELLRDNPFTPTSTLAQSIMRHCPLLNELVIVREWLHDCAPAPIVPEAANGYWKFTKHRLTQAQRTGNRKDVETLVQELDPDAVNRDDVRVLAADDANYEKQLAHSLYSFVRAGKLNDAIELCRRAHRPWRAASIRGSQLFQWRILAYDCDDPANVMEDVGWSGNKQRRLWKSTCTRAALNTSLSDPDRALYASLAPSPATSVVLKSACRTWADHLWAQVSIICEGKQVDELARVNGGFWEGGMAAVELITKMKAAGDEPEPEELEKENTEWEREVFSSMEPLKNIPVSEGPPANDPYHASQLHIILNQTDKLLEDFATGLQTGEFNPEQPNFTALTRFFAHFCLFLRLIDIPVPHAAIQIILEVYLQVLEEADQREHIALYASALGENAVDRYALFLANLPVVTSIDERRIALYRAEDHGLDIIKVAQVTAEKTVAACFARLPAQKTTLPLIVTRGNPLTDDEELLIRSIEWTVFLEETYVNALEQSNAIFRYFLEHGKLRAAETLLSMLPPGVRAVNAPDVHRIEFAHYMQFFEIWEALERVTEHQAAESSFTTKGAKANWLNDLKELVKDAQTKIVELLTSDWLISHEELSRSNTFRSKSLSHIRQIYIPELVIRLHALLMKTGTKISSNYAEAMKLANIVADSRYSLYDDFLKNNQERLWEYLHSIQQCLLQGLADGEDHGEPFWFMVASTHSS